MVSVAWGSEVGEGIGRGWGRGEGIVLRELMILFHHYTASSILAYTLRQIKHDDDNGKTNVLHETLLIRYITRISKCDAKILQRLGI